jgi:hypothetical protein
MLSSGQDPDYGTGFGTGMRAVSYRACGEMLLTNKTRYFVIVSLLVLMIGVGTGLVAYYVGFPTSALQRAAGPDDLKFLPRNATLVASVNVTDVMTSKLRNHLREAMPETPNGQRDFENETGINIETDIDRVVAALAPDNGIVLARGRFNDVKIEALMREHGALVEDYKGVRIIVAEAPANVDSSRAFRNNGLSVAFVESGLVAIGSSMLVKNAIDLKSGGDNVTANEELMNLVQSLDNGNVWAVGRFDALSAQARLPGELAQRLPPITWFSANGQINGGVSGVLRAETRDDASAENLRDVVRGFLALAKMQSGSNPEILAMVQSLQLGGTGKTVALSFDVPEAVFDFVASVAHKGGPKQLQ